MATKISPRPRLLSSSTSWGNNVLWPAARELKPTMWTSLSTASCAVSSGVWNKGPISTSKPISAKDVAITLAPRSWPSWPILAIMIRGRRPSRSSKSSAIWRTSLITSSSSYSLEYTPEIERITALWRPHTFSTAKEISPKDARARAASSARASKLPSPDSVACVIASRQDWTLSSSRLARNCSRRRICASRTAVLSTSRISNGSSLSRRYLLIPMIASRPESIRAWRRAAASSIRILGRPVSIAFAIPPRDSISWIWPQARRINSSVNAST